VFAVPRSIAMSCDMNLNSRMTPLSRLGGADHRFGFSAILLPRSACFG
jgi:hypothetical protein